MWPHFWLGVTIYIIQRTFNKYLCSKQRYWSWSETTPKWYFISQFLHSLKQRYLKFHYYFRCQYFILFISNNIMERKRFWLNIYLTHNITKLDSNFFNIHLYEYPFFTHNLYLCFTPCQILFVFTIYMWSLTLLHQVLRTIHFKILKTMKNNIQVTLAAGIGEKGE